MKIKVYKLDSFAKNIKGGNPAGVVLYGDNLLDREMQKIASIMKLSETAFVMKSNLADFKVRFFTPTEEVDLCGHATIATFSLLAKKKIIVPGIYTQETKAGILNVEVNEDLSVMMNQGLPKFFEVIDKGIIAKSLNITVNSFINELPIQIVSTGAKDIIIPIKTKEILNNIKPDFEKIIKVCKEFGVIGYHIFTFETVNKALVNCRNFAPLYGINEESATGTSCGALISYLFKYGKADMGSNNIAIIEQGYSMDKPSEIKVSIELNNNEIIRVKVGGSTMNIEEIDVVI